MSLKSIRADVASKLAFNVADPAEKAFVDNRINQAADEIWTKNDLPGSLRELVLYYDGTTKQVALPYFIMIGRGFRFYNSQYKIPINTMHPRYQIQGFGQYSLNWREKQKSPVAILITNQSVLNFVLPHAESNAIDIYVIGTTPTAYKVQEKVTIPAGSLTVATTNNYIELFSISKSAVNTYNIAITDADDTVIGEIPNSELSGRYIIMQVLDDNIEGSSLTTGVEVLYKPFYQLLVNDYDEFQEAKYDQAIYWKVLEHYHGRQDDSEATQRAMAAQAKCEQLVNEIAKNALIGKDMEIQYAPNQFYGLWRPNNWLGTKFRQ